MIAFYILSREERKKRPDSQCFFAVLITIDSNFSFVCYVFFVSVKWSVGRICLPVTPVKLSSWITQRFVVTGSPQFIFALCKLIGDKQKRKAAYLIAYKLFSQNHIKVSGSFESCFCFCSVINLIFCMSVNSYKESCCRKRLPWFLGDFIPSLSTLVIFVVNCSFQLQPLY